MDKLVQQIVKLLSIKSVVTIGIVGTIVYLGIMGKVAPDKMVDLAYIIIGFYFGIKATDKGA